MKRITAYAALTLALLAPSLAEAQTFPTKPISIIVPYAAGGNIDLIARLLQGLLAGSLGQPIVVENRTGAAGLIAGDFVARAEPDGHTLLMGSNGPVVLAPMTMQNASYRWETAFQPVSMTAIGVNVLAVRAGLPVASLSEMLAYAKANPDKFTVAADTGASINHFLSELLKLRSGVHWAEVRYRGNAPAVNDLVAGHIDAMFVQLFDVSEQVGAGKIKLLAVLGKERASKIPEISTSIEQGFPDVEGTVFNGVLAPKRTPRPIVDKLSAAIRSALAQKEVTDKLAALGAEARGSTPDEFTAFLEADTRKWADVLKQANFKVGD